MRFPVCLFGCFWPLAARRNAKNSALRIAAICHKAEFGLGQISASWMAENGQ